MKVKIINNYTTFKTNIEVKWKKNYLYVFKVIKQSLLFIPITRLLRVKSSCMDFFYIRFNFEDLFA